MVDRGSDGMARLGQFGARAVVVVGMALALQGCPSWIGDYYNHQQVEAAAVAMTPEAAFDTVLETAAALSYAPAAAKLTGYHPSCGKWREVLQQRNCLRLVDGAIFFEAQFKGMSTTMSAVISRPSAGNTTIQYSILEAYIDGEDDPDEIVASLCRILIQRFGEGNVWEISGGERTPVAADRPCEGWAP